MIIFNEQVCRIWLLHSLRMFNATCQWIRSWVERCMREDQLKTAMVVECPGLRLLAGVDAQNRFCIVRTLRPESHPALGSNLARIFRIMENMFSSSCDAPPIVLIIPARRSQGPINSSDAQRVAYCASSDTEFSENLSNSFEV